MVAAIAVMAKAPRPGRCKTRLVPPLSPEQAATLSAAFLRDITTNLFRAGAGVVPHVAYAPAGTEAEIASIVAPDTRLVLADGSAAMPDGVEGFGRCLLQAIGALLEGGFASAGVLNSDSPTLPTDYLRRAAAWLAADADTVVLGPAEDGGYYFLGMRKAHAGLFADIAWSTPSVAAQTRQRAAALGLELRELPPWYDIDDAASFARLRRELGRADRQGYAAPATAAWLAANREEAESQRRFA